MIYTILISMVMKYFRTLKTKDIMKYVSNEEGIVAIEYILIAVLVAIAIIGGAYALGDQLNTIFSAIAGYLSGDGTPAPTVPTG